MNKLFLDTNVLMEIFFKRPKYKQIQDFLESYSNFYISFLTVHIVMYFSELEKLNPKDTFALLENFEILKNDQNTFDLAKDLYDGKDFEDALQIASCLNAGIDNFLTLDKNLAKKYSNKLNITLL